ncbi:MAG: 5-formyltetrahydrofolate cyclo-ligase [Cytophagaceae bacterium]|nr:5-formyltetrahydrofolate cyclo-ligase [Cytophagaceae bacterium]
MKKAALRKEYINKRENLSGSQIENFSSAIAALVFDKINFSKISSVHIFLPIKNKKEIDTWHIINRLRIDFPHIDIVIPKIVSDSVFENYLLTPETELKESKLGIPEPVRAETYAADKIDLIFVPLLAADKKGHRVGYGKGFYDRFLVQCRRDAIKTGLSFFDPADAIEDINENDIALNSIITPEKIYSFSGL